PAKRRKRGTRGGRRRKKGPGVAVEIDRIPGEVDELPELAELPAETLLVAGEEEEEETRAERSGTEPSAAREGRGGRRGGRKASRRETGRRAEEPERERAAAEAPKRRLILVNAADPEETRVAVVEDGRIVDLQMTVQEHASYVSDIYRGRVVNLEPAIGAAFVDFGQGRNGFLHASDVLSCYGDSDWNLSKLLSTTVDSEDLAASSKSAEETEVDEAEEPGEGRRGRGRRGGGGPGRSGARIKRPRLPIEGLVKKGQMVAVQITKDAIGDKGPTLTTYISIPSRYLVLMPSLARTGVSRKIEDEKERRRLKRILSSLNIPEGMGVIVRTAGVGKTKTEIKRDLDYLMLTWEDFSRRLVSGRNPAPLYQESDVAIRTVRDLFTASTEAVLVDDEEVYRRVVEFTRRLMPEHEDRIKLHQGPRPLFHLQGVEQDFEKIFSRRVELPSGGSIVFDQTEALVAIDVNSGRTREAGADFEDIALKTNLEAVPEIARQIRLRDLGGIIVLDFIDMMRAGSRLAVERAVREVFKGDRARSKIGRISQFGLLELTRQRLGPGLTKLVYTTCRHCRGSGRQRNPSSRAQAVLRRLGAALSLKGFTAVEVRAHPDAIELLRGRLAGELAALETRNGRKVTLVAAPDQLEDSVLHYLRADGREVRPGGRRKR
ncbi:MAG: Rne/Rng family ribonuclease, partial [Planctomycetota bacterium]